MNCVDRDQWSFLTEDLCEVQGADVQCANDQCACCQSSHWDPNDDGEECECGCELEETRAECPCCRNGTENHTNATKMSLLVMGILYIFSL